MKYRLFRPISSLVSMLLIALITGFLPANTQENPPTLVPTLTPFDTNPFDMNMDIPFPLLDCPEIESPFAGPAWGEITIGHNTMEDLRDYVTELSPYYSDYYDPYLQSIEFLAVSIKFAKSEQIPYKLGACIHPEDGIITAIFVPLFNLDVQTHMSALVAEYGAPDLVLWGVALDERVLLWLTEGIAASVSVDESEQFNPYGTVELIVYFPYQELEGYEDRWPYTHRASSASQLVTLTPYVPHEINPFDFDAIIATLTAEPSRTPTSTASP